MRRGMRRGFLFAVLLVLLLASACIGYGIALVPPGYGVVPINVTPTATVSAAPTMTATLVPTQQSPTPTAETHTWTPTSTPIPHQATAAQIAAYARQWALDNPGYTIIASAQTANWGWSEDAITLPRSMSLDGLMYWEPDVNSQRRTVWWGDNGPSAKIVRLDDTWIAAWLNSFIVFMRIRQTPPVTPTSTPTVTPSPTPATLADVRAYIDQVPANDWLDYMDWMAPLLRQVEVYKLTEWNVRIRARASVDSAFVGLLSDGREVQLLPGLYEGWCAFVLESAAATGTPDTIVFTSADWAGARVRNTGERVPC